ncbi:MAG: transcription elongation factor GreA [Chloroflexota bacterium]
MTQDVSAPALLRSVGLLADGPAVWGRPVPAQGPGVFVVELPAPLPAAPIELTKVGKWLERVGTLRLDREVPTSKALAARIGSFWLPSQTVVYIGASEASVARRVAAMARTELGDRRPAAGGHWLKTLRSLDGVKLWWAATDAPVEYEDALLAAFAAGVPGADLAALPDQGVVLPWANLRMPTGERKPSGLTGALTPEPVVAPLPPTRLVRVPDGDADGARGEPPAPKRRPVAPRAPRAPRAPKTIVQAPALMAAPAEAVVGAEALTPDGEARLRAELDELTRVKRPDVLGRIRTAKEHGDLKENAEYHSAREEQSFLEGRVQAIEARLRSAVIVEAPVAGSRVGLGSVVTVDDDGETFTYTIVGADESDPPRGRISSSSPVGRALVGRDTGDFVLVATPAGERRYRILEIG